MKEKEEGARSKHGLDDMFVATNTGRNFPGDRTNTRQEEGRQETALLFNVEA